MNSDIIIFRHSLQVSLRIFARYSDYFFLVFLCGR